MTGRPCFALLFLVSGLLFPRDIVPSWAGSLVPLMIYIQYPARARTKTSRRTLRGFSRFHTVLRVTGSKSPLSKYINKLRPSVETLLSYKAVSGTFSRNTATQTLTMVCNQAVSRTLSSFFKTPLTRYGAIQASEQRLYTFSPETLSKMRSFRLGTSRSKDPQAQICTTGPPTIV